MTLDGNQNSDWTAPCAKTARNAAHFQEFGSRHVKSEGKAKTAIAMPTLKGQARAVKFDQAPTGGTALPVEFN